MKSRIAIFAMVGTLLSNLILSVAVPFGHWGRDRELIVIIFFAFLVINALIFAACGLVDWLFAILDFPLKALLMSVVGGIVAALARVLITVAEFKFPLTGILAVLSGAIPAAACSLLVDWVAVSRQRQAEGSPRDQ